jgi:hypothetical protein
MLTGIRMRQHRTTPVTPMLTVSASRPEDACDWLAPTARRPDNTMAKELVKPISAASTPSVV